MELHTTSEVMNLAKDLENKSAKFYERLSQEYIEHEGFFLNAAKENHNNIVQIERAYYSVITDAIEGCFAFKMEQDEYNLETLINGEVTHTNAFHRTIEVEEMIIKFYSDAVRQSSALMADLPRAFKLLVKKRNKRKTKLQLMSNRQG